MLIDIVSKFNEIFPSNFSILDLCCVTLSIKCKIVFNVSKSDFVIFILQLSIFKRELHQQCKKNIFETNFLRANDVDVNISCTQETFQETADGGVDVDVR